MKDLLLNDNGDLGIANNDLQIGYSDLQHQEHILIAQKGNFKESPDVGVGVENFINDSDIDGLLSEVRAQFEKDGMTVTRVDYDENDEELIYDANY